MRKALVTGITVLLVTTCPLLAFGEAGLSFRECMVGGVGVQYFFWVCAGDETVNDLEICVYDEAGNAVGILAISAPPSWTSHATDNCGVWSTTENPIPPGECLDEFDFLVPPGYCVLVIEWWLTRDGTVVASGQATFVCGFTAIEESTWGSIKSVYR